MSNVKGFKELSAALSKLGANVTQEVKDIVAVNTGDLETAAIRDAKPDYLTTTYGVITQAQQFAKGWKPVDQHIFSKEENGGLSGTVYVERDAGLAAVYREFGTGQDAAAYLATVDPEWRDEARKYYVNGKGTIIGKPYIWPNYLKQRIQFIKELKEMLNKLKL